MGPDDDGFHRERRWGAAAAAAASDAATAEERSEAVLRAEYNAREFLGSPGYAAVDATIAEGMGMGVSEPTPAPRSRLMFQRMTPSTKIPTPPVNRPQQPSSPGSAATPRRRRGVSSSYGGDSCDLSRFLCHACGTGKRTRPTVCCRNCLKLYHPMCAGYEPSSRKYPPPDWICPKCPGGERGPNDKQVHASLHGKGTLTKGSQTWCPVCFKDNRVLGQWKSKSLDGGQRCPGCGLKAHAACLRLRADRTWPCVECKCRKEGLPPNGLFEAHSRVLVPVASSGNKSSSRERDVTRVRTVLPSPNDSESMQPHGEGDPGALATTAPELVEQRTTFHASMIKSSTDPSKRHMSEGRAHAWASLGDKPFAPPALHAHGNSIPSFTAGGQPEKSRQRKCAEATVVTARLPVRAPGGWKPYEAVANRGEARNFSNRGRTVAGAASFSAAATSRDYGVGTPRSSAHKLPLEDRSRRGTVGSVEAARNSRRSKAALGGSSAGASVVICKTCKKKGRLKSGRTCAGCKQWWHANADCSAAARGSHPDASEVGNWVGGWRCQGCLDDWEDGVRARTAEVVKAWTVHEKKRELKAREFQAAKEAAMAESVEAKRHGFVVDTVEVPPIPHPPAGILPFLDVSSIRDTGFRLARIGREDCAFMGRESVLAKVDLCWEHRIFTIIEGVFDPQVQPLMDFLEERKSLSCRISGKAAAGESSSTMGDYRARLADRLDKPCKDSPGTFFLDTANGQTEVLNWLPTDPLMSAFMPESPRGGLEDHIIGDRCKFGPFTFGGGRNFPLEYLDVGLAGRQSQRNYMKGKGRDRIGGSTTHMDGMGSFTAIGGLKDGVKKVTAFETADCATALAVAKFRSFAKPGGSRYVVNNRIDDDSTLRRRLSAAGVRSSTFLIRAGDAYLVPSGALHEFMNEVPCLSVAWNIMPHPANCAVAMKMAEASAMEAEAELGVNTDRSQSAIEYAPPEAMRERLAGFVIKRWLEQILLRRRCKKSIAAGAPLPGLDNLAPAQAAVMWAELAARHEVPASVRKRFVCYWPNSDFYNESKPVFEGKMDAMGKGRNRDDEAKGDPNHGYSPALKEVLAEATQIVTPQTVQPQTKPRQTLQQRNISPQMMQQQTVPPQTVQKQTVPQQKLPPQTVPLQTVPQQKVPPQTVSPQTVPHSALRMKEVHPCTSPTPSRVPLARPYTNAHAKPPATPHHSPAPAPSVGLPPQAPPVGVAPVQPPIVTPSPPVFGAPSSTAPPDRPLLTTTCWMQPTSYSWLPAPPSVHGGSSKLSTGGDTIDVGLDPPGDAATCSDMTLGVPLALSVEEMVPSESDSTAAADPIDVGLDLPGGVVQSSHPTLNAALAQSMAGVTPNANRCGVDLTRGGSGPVVTEHALSSWCGIGDRNTTAGISCPSPEATFGSSGLVAPVGICTGNGDDINGEVSDDKCSQGATMQAIGGVNSVCPCSDGAVTRKSVESGRDASVSGEPTGMGTFKTSGNTDDDGNRHEKLERRPTSLSRIGIGTPEREGADRSMVVVGHSEQKARGYAACLGGSRLCDSPSGTHGDNDDGSKYGQERMVLGSLEGVENGRLASQVAGGDSAEDSKGAAGGEQALMNDIPEVSPSKRLLEVPQRLEGISPSRLVSGDVTDDSDGSVGAERFAMNDDASEVSLLERVFGIPRDRGQKIAALLVGDSVEDEIRLDMPDGVKRKPASGVARCDSADDSDGATGGDCLPMNDNDSDASPSESVCEGSHGEGGDDSRRVAGGEEDETVLGLPDEVKEKLASQMTSGDSADYSEVASGDERVSMNDNPDVSQSERGFGLPGKEEGEPVVWVAGVGESEMVLGVPGRVEREEASRVAGSDGADGSKGATGGECVFRNDEAEVSPSPMFGMFRLDCGGEMAGEVEDLEGCLAEAACGGADDDPAEHDADTMIEEPSTGPCAHASESSPTEEPLWVAGDRKNEMVLGLVEEKATSRVAGADDADDSKGSPGGEAEVSPSRMFGMFRLDCGGEMAGEVEDLEGCLAEAACGGADDDPAEHDADAMVEEPSTGPCAHASESSPTEEPLWVAGDRKSEMVLGLVEEKATSRVAGGDDADDSKGSPGGEAEVSPSPMFGMCRLDCGGEMANEVEDLEGCLAEAACGGADDDPAEHDADAMVEESSTGPCAHASESSPTEEPLWVAGDRKSEMVLGLVEEKATSRVAGGDDADDSKGSPGGEAEVSPLPMFGMCRLDCGGKMAGEVEDLEGCLAEAACGGADVDPAEHDADAMIEESSTGPCAHASESSPTEERLWVAGDRKSEMALGLVEEKATSRVAGGDDADDSKGSPGGEAEVPPSRVFGMCRLDCGGEMAGEVEDLEGCLAEAACGGADVDPAEHDADAMVEEPSTGPCAHASESSPTEEPLWVAGDTRSGRVLGLAEEKATSRVAGGDDADDGKGSPGGERVSRNDEAEVSPPPMFGMFRLDCGGEMAGEVEDLEGCLADEACGGAGDSAECNADAIIEEAVTGPCAHALENTSTEELSSDSSATTGAAGAAITAESIETRNAPITESGNRSQSSMDESPACDIPGTRLLSNASSFGDRSADEDVEGICSKDLPAMLLAVPPSPPPLSSTTPLETKSCVKRGGMVARADGDFGGTKSVGECELAEVASKKLDGKQPDHSPMMRKVSRRHEHHSHDSQSRSSSSGRSGSDGRYGSPEMRRDANGSSRGRTRADMGSSRSLRQSKDSHCGYDSRDRSRRESSAARDRSSRERARRSRPPDSADRDRRRSCSSQGGGSRREVFRRKYRLECDYRRDHGRDHVWGRDRKCRGLNVDRKRGEGRERERNGGRRYSHERAHLAPRDRRDQRSQRQRCLPRREGGDGRDRRPADDVGRHRLRRSRERGRVSDGGKGIDKGGGYSFSRRHRSRSRDNDRGRRNTCDSNARRDGRLEALSRNPSSRHLAAKTKVTEQPQQGEVPKAAVGKRTTPSGRDKDTGSGGGGLRRNRDIDRDVDGGKGRAKGGGHSFSRLRRSRSHDEDRSRRDTCNSNARRGGRLEASSRNSSSRDFLAVPQTTEQSQQDEVPEAAVGKRTTPSDRDQCSSGGDSGDTAHHCPRFFLGRAGVLHRAKLVQNNVARKDHSDDRAVGLPDDAKSRLGPAPPVIPPVGHALMPPVRKILSWNSGTAIDEKPGRDRRLASAHATDTEATRRLESSPGSGGKEQDAADGAQSSAAVPLDRVFSGSGNIEGMTAAVPRVSNKNADQAAAVGGDVLKPTPSGRVCYRHDEKVGRSTLDMENIKADLKRRRPWHTGDADAGGVSRLRMERGFASQRYPATPKVRVDVASSSSSRASSAAAAAAAAAASKASGTVHARPLSGIGVRAERLRVGGGSFADVFTDPAALRLGASSNGWAESSISSQSQRGSEGAERRQLGCVIDSSASSRSLNSKRRVLAGSFPQPEVLEQTRGSSACGSSTKCGRIKGISQHDVLPGGDGTCVDKKRDRSVLGYSGRRKRENPPDDGQSRASDGSSNLVESSCDTDAFLEERKKRCRR